MEKIDIRSLTKKELTESLLEAGEKKFRASQVYQWLHEKQAEDFDSMSNLSKALRDKLKEQYKIAGLEEVETQISALDETRKYLFRLDDGHVVESVYMKYKHGSSVCISTQVGCRMGCRFCASAIGGLTRHLTTGEMLGQVYAIQKDTGVRVSNVVLMGTGEPLDNYEQVVRFIRMISSEDGLGISQRNLTLSTCGLVPQIRKLADEGFQVTLAISLHASNDEKRKKIMPVAYQYNIEEILSACDYFFEKTGRRISFEYSLIGGVNDTQEDAGELVALLHGRNCHVNLIPVNPIKEREFCQSDKKIVLNFKNKLEKCRINVTIRREMGQDIDGACGQLRKSYREKNA